MEFTKVEIFALVAMAFGVFMDGLDSSVANIALPSIAGYFGTDASAVAWVVIVYFMMIAGLMLIFGRIADSGHTKKVYVLGFVLFSAASLACGLSESLGLLVASRVVQGIGAAMLGAVAPMMCVKYLSRDKLGIGMSLLMVAGALGFLSGPAVGGMIIDVSSWHWIFFINVPIGTLAVLLSLTILPKDSDTSESRLDLVGSALLFLSIVCGVYVIEMLSDESQTMINIIMLTIMVVSLILFVAVEKRVRYPVLKLGMFRNWMFTSSLMCYALLSVAYVGAAYLVPFYLTKELALSYTFSGLLIMIPSFVTIITSVPTGKYGDRHGRRGLSIASTVFLLLSLIGYWIVDPSMGWTPFVVIGILSGIMWGLCGSVASRIVDLSDPPERGMASTMSNFAYYVGGSIGSALFATLVTFGSGTIGVPIDLITSEEFMDGYKLAMLCGVILSVASLVCAAIINENKVRTS